MSLHWQLSMTIRIRNIATEICEETGIYKRNDCWQFWISWSQRLNMNAYLVNEICLPPRF